MGLRRFYELAGMRPPDQSHPIGTVPRRQKLSATLSGVNPSGDVEFGKEIEIEQEFGWRRLPPEQEGSRVFRVWMGFEIQTIKPELRGCTLVIATYPYSTDWFDWADFKPILNRGREERLRPLQAPMEQVNETFRSRNKCRSEPLDTRPGWLTARLSLPTRTEDLAITLRAGARPQTVWKAFESLMNGRHQRSKKSDVWCFGACREFERCRELLRISPEAMRLLDKTEDGTLFDYRRKSGPSPFRTVGPTAKGVAREVLESSIVKALAGTSPTLERTVESGKLRLVAPLMEKIYDGAMYNLVKRLKEPVEGGKVERRNIEATVAAAEPIPEVSFDEQVDFFRRGFREQPPTEAFRYQIEKRLAGEDDEDRILACAALMGAYTAGVPPQRTFDRLLQRIADDPNEDPSVRWAAQTVLDLMRKADPPSN